jgi:hypothetical protein
MVYLIIGIGLGLVYLILKSRQILVEILELKFQTSVDLKGISELIEKK